jgi:hypothetical protein
VRVVSVQIWPYRLAMPRKPISIEVVEEGDERFVVLTYPKGEVVKRRVELERKASRRPRIPQTRLNLADKRNRKS